ncbi:MAG: TlpA family protein disulfide reductase [Flavipsychrobacter sp.]|nr:TlpA family protein disulfide reductase [Flavipsychrobacter sp.]
MNRYLTSFLLMMCELSTASAQSSFRLEGKVDVDSGTIVLIPAHDSLLYPKEHYYREARIRKGAFSFEGEIAYPLPMMLSLKEGDRLRFRSTWFYLDGGLQKADWQTNNTQATDAHVRNAAMEEQEKYAAAFAEVQYRLHQLMIGINGMEDVPANAGTKATLQAQHREQTEKKYAMIVQYAKEHPASYLPLWDAARMLDLGFLPFYDTLWASLSETVKNSVPGRAFREAVDKLKLTVSGQKMPLLPVTDGSGKDTVIAGAPAGYTYTLVDFWYSSCYPCMRMFPGFKKVYEEYHPKGFELIAISIDEGSYIDNWKKVIAEKGLPWPQYLDKNKQLVQRLHIQRFPTSFLLDSEGRIVAQDLRPEALEAFLKEQLK